jgi:hypothetical protein
VTALSTRRKKEQQGLSSSLFLIDLGCLGLSNSHTMFANIQCFILFFEFTVYKTTVDRESAFFVAFLKLVQKR